MSKTTRNTSKNIEEKQQEPKINRFYLQHLRQNIAKLTQEQLAEKLNVIPKRVQNWESGRKPPSIKDQHALEVFFGIPGGDLTQEMPDILVSDFNAAYFQHSDPRDRIEWAERHIRIGHSLGIIPAPPKYPYEFPHMGR